MNRELVNSISFYFIQKNPVQLFDYILIDQYQLKPDLYECVFVFVDHIMTSAQV